MKNFFSATAIVAIVILLGGCASVNGSSPSTATQTATAYFTPAADEIIQYKSEAEFVQAFADKNSGIARMDYKLPNFYLRPAKLPSDIKLKVIQMDTCGYIWQYTTPEETGVWVSTVHNLLSKSHSLEDEVKANSPSKYEQYKKVTINGRDYMYLDAMNVELGFTLIEFMDNDTLVIVLVGGYSFSEDFIDKYCNVEKVAVNNIAQAGK